MIGKGKSISHGVAALEYDLAKEINGQAVATEIARHELYGCTGAEMVQEMKPYHIDFPNVKNNCLRFEVSPSIEESATFTDADWAELGNDFMQRMGLANHQYIIIRHSGTESKKEQAHLHILANRVSLSGELYRDNWIGKKATEAANAIAKERNFVQSQDIGKVNKAEIKEAMDGVLKKMQGFDFTKFKEELGKRGFKVREARASTGKLNGYYVTARSGTEYKASEIGKGYTLAHIERTQSKLKCNSMNISHGCTRSTWAAKARSGLSARPLTKYASAPPRSVTPAVMYQAVVPKDSCASFTTIVTLSSRAAFVGSNAQSESSPVALKAEMSLPMASM